MKSLKESLLKRPNNTNQELNKLFEETIIDFLEKNYKKFNKKYLQIKRVNFETIVDYHDSLIFTGDEQLTNGLFRFGEVENFDCSLSPSLTNLEGAPEIVKYAFWCSDCKKLKSLEGGPKFIGKEFDCGYCKKLESLEGLPQTLNDNGYILTCSGCENLKNLKGCPEHLESITASECGFESLEGAPEKVFGMMNLRSCKNLTTLKGCPKKLTLLLLPDCINLHSLKYIDPKYIKKVQISKDSMTITDMGDVSKEKIHYV